MIKINQTELKTALKAIGGIVAMVVVGSVVNSFGIPVEFSIGGNNMNNSFQPSVSTAQRAIEAIMKGAEHTQYPSEISSAADDIYNIACENRYDEDVASYAVAALGKLVDKASYPSTRKHIIELIRNIATF